MNTTTRKQSYNFPPKSISLAQPSTAKSQNAIDDLARRSIQRHPRLFPSHSRRRPGGSEPESREAGLDAAAVVGNTAVLRRPLFAHGLRRGAHQLSQ